MIKYKSYDFKTREALKKYFKDEEVLIKKYERGRVLAAETTQQYLTGKVVKYPYETTHPNLPLLRWIYSSYIGSLAVNVLEEEFKDNFLSLHIKSILKGKK